MTRDEFYEIDTWYELLEFCDDVDYSHDDVFTWDELCSWVDGEIRDRIRQVEWTEVRDFLNELPSADEYEVYIQDSDYDFCGSDDDDDDFQNYKDSVEEWCDDNDMFDDDEEDEEDEEWDEDEDDESAEEPLRTSAQTAVSAQESLEPEPVSFAELFEGSAAIRSIAAKVSAAQPDKQPDKQPDEMPDEQPDEMPFPW